MTYNNEHLDDELSDDEMDELRVEEAQRNVRVTLDVCPWSYSLIDVTVTGAGQLSGLTMEEVEVLVEKLTQAVTCTQKGKGV